MKVLLTGVSGQLGHDAAKMLTARGVDFLGVSSAGGFARLAEWEASLARLLNKG